MPLPGRQHCTAGQDRGGRQGPPHASQATLTTLLSNLHLTRTTTARDMLKGWYNTHTMRIGNITLGPYTEDCNRGVHAVTVVDALGRAAAAPYVAPDGCRVVFTEPELNVLAIALSAAAAVVLFLLVVALVKLRGRQRDNSAAPHTPGQSFAVILTDIQCSTALWAKLPGRMARAVGTHHYVIRTLIARHRSGGSGPAEDSGADWSLTQSRPFGLDNALPRPPSPRVHTARMTECEDMEGMPPVHEGDRGYSGSHFPKILNKHLQIFYSRQTVAQITSYFLLQHSMHIPFL